MKFGIIWFLVGLGAQLQIVYSLSITEVCVYAAAPLLYFIERPHMRRTGVLRFFQLSLLVVIGCVVACWQNHTPFEATIRGLAVTCLIPCAIVVGHYLFRNDMGGFKWMLVGVMLSSFLCTFWFQRSVEAAMLSQSAPGEASAADIMSGPHYWIGRLNALINLPARGWYLQCPIVYSFCAPMFMAAFSLLTSVSGRSAALGALGAAILVLLGGKRPQGIKRRICDRFWLLVVIGVVGIFTAATMYRIAATSGWLGEESRQKYENQTQGDTSIGRLLLGGRMESFCGLLACIDKPLVGSIGIMWIVYELCNRCKVVTKLAPLGMTTLWVYILHQWLLDRVVGMAICAIIWAGLLFCFSHLCGICVKRLVERVVNIWLVRVK